MGGVHVYWILVERMDVSDGTGEGPPAPIPTPLYPTKCGNDVFVCEGESAVFLVVFDSSFMSFLA